MRRVIESLCLFVCLTVIGCIPSEPLETVSYVEPERYVGLWYEIARYPNVFQLDCAGGTTAEYTLRDDGRIDVINTCHTGSIDGPEKKVEGVARIVDDETNAKLKVGFGLFEGNYWIIGLDEDYQWAVVGEPSRRFLWILSRTPLLDDDIYESILTLIEEKGYDTEKLIMTPQMAE